ncbi:hypothetical protein [Candidatus Nitrosocosmicus hydrocola]|nr:hypothetical protein [Candidatus Nitrosocosmicus hydrocola]
MSTLPSRRTALPVQRIVKEIYSEVLQMEISQIKRDPSVNDEYLLVIT